MTAARAQPSDWGFGGSEPGPGGRRGRHHGPAVLYVAAAGEVAEALAPQVRGKIVIDATNPLKPDGSGLASEGGLSGAETIASWLPGAPFKP